MVQLQRHLLPLNTKPLDIFSVFCSIFYSMLVLEIKCSAFLDYFLAHYTWFKYMESFPVYKLNKPIIWHRCVKAETSKTCRGKGSWDQIWKLFAKGLLENLGMLFFFTSAASALFKPCDICFLDLHNNALSKKLQINYCFTLLCATDNLFHVISEEYFYPKIVLIVEFWR